MANQFLCLLLCSVVEEGEQAGGTSNRRCYLTITAVPALNSCSACFQVAASYEEDGKQEYYWLWVKQAVQDLDKPENSEKWKLG